jgi:hypothetical protein
VSIQSLAISLNATAIAMTAATIALTAPMPPGGVFANGVPV